MKHKLLTRDEFRESVFKRDKGMCVIPGCCDNAVDAHHIYERRLWTDGGYYLCNGASLCEEHHKLAERGKLTPNALRYYCGTKSYVQPKCFIDKYDYDKWGNELKYSNNIVKYPTTFYVPFSDIPKHHTKDLADIRCLIGVPVAITTKMDGSNIKLTYEKVTARNGYCATHKSFDMLKARHALIKNRIPSNYSIFGEWLYAKHSISYIYLEDYLQIFAVYNNETHEFLPWEKVEYWADVIKCKTVPLLKTTFFTTQHEFNNYIKKLADDVILHGDEGIVVRNIWGFHISEFSKNVMKYVRPNHVQTDVHWKTQKIVKNNLKK